MTNLIGLTVRELKALWYSPIAYWVGGGFLLLQGFAFWYLVLALNDPRIDPLWNITRVFFGTTLFFWLPMFVLPPVLTMRTFSEEKRTGTFEVLMTAPVTDLQVALSKFLGAWLSFCALWAMTLPLFLMLRIYAPLDWGALCTGYAGTWLLGGVLIAIGIFASSTTRNQVIAAFLTFVVITFLFFVGFMDTFITDPHTSAILRYVSLAEHFRAFSKGIVDTRPVVFYLSMIVVMLFLTVRTISNPRWRT